MLLELCDDTSDTVLFENNGVALKWVAPLFSMRIILLVLSQSFRSVDADAWCKLSLKRTNIFDTGSHQLHDRAAVVQPEAAGERDSGLQAPADGGQQAESPATSRLPSGVSLRLQGKRPTHNVCSLRLK